ncbi:hypothetical protein QP027_00770 [Corynebacterium breve]|uniref:Permease n=1 Tax=Corynebacterium breve TaxID=3049799 RepID=A0ABY8VE87_9CORY|nr:hypothetical protein [Corynebacterium breve]WIM67966.1 hypothetical protein QP027_00770 [Corynebacterium breve]
MIKNLGEKYSPLYFLAALGFGGLAVFFFMAFMHITPHPGTAMPTFETIMDAYAEGDGFMRSVIVAGYIGMTIFLVIHFTLLAWNLREFFAFKRTAAYDDLKQSNAEVTLMAIPLTLGMSINGIFVAAMAFIPNLTSILQALMPFALLAYGAVGVLALVIMGNYLRRLITTGTFSFEGNAGLNQIIAVFGFAMVGVGFAAPAAMGTNTWVVLIAVWGSMFFAMIAVLLFIVFLVSGVMSIKRYGLAVGNSATMWLAIPTMTLWAITVLRDRHGLQTLVNAGPGGPQEHPSSSVGLMFFLSIIIVLQAAFFGLGHIVMKSNGFYRDYVLGREITSPAAFTLVCPGVGISVLLMFFINVGLVQNGLLEKFSAGYYVALAIPAITATATIWLGFTLFRNQLSKASKFAREMQQAPEVVNA